MFKESNKQNPFSDLDDPSRQLVVCVNEYIPVKFSIICNLKKLVEKIYQKRRLLEQTLSENQSLSNI